ncbi:Sushi domain-containing protein 2, partial [Stylophora pistillata]
MSVVTNGAVNNVIVILTLARTAEPVHWKETPIAVAVPLATMVETARQNGGTCSLHYDTYSCACPAGFNGTNCTIDPCYNTNPCENDGQCFVDDNHQFFCVCPIPKAYEGRNCSKPVDCFWNKMYPFGKEQNDTEMDVRLIRDELCTEIVYDYGIWFFDDKHYVLYICANGMIRFDVGYARHFPVPTFDTEEFPFRVPMLFPFWSKIDLFDSFCSSEQDCLSGNIDYENRSAVFYKVYMEDKGVMNASHILYKASKDVRENSDDPKFDSFTASWVLVVTWLRLRPEEELEGDAEEGVVVNANAFRSSASPGITSLTLGKENADKDGEYFFRLERRTGEDPETKCRKWSDWQETNLKPEISIVDNFIPGCPCTFDQALLTTSYFLTNFTAPFSTCFKSISDLPFNKVVDSSSANGFIFRKCCYSTFLEDSGALLTDSNDAGGLEVLYRNKPEDLMDDAEAKQACCVDSFSCQLYDDLRPTDNCGGFFILPRRWFWGDPHFKTLDDKNYTFNGVGEYTMVDGKDGKFKLQARTVLAPGNLSIATVFSAGAAQETGSSKVEVRIKSGGGVQMYINGALYSGLDSLTSVSKDIGGNLRAAKKNPGCVEVTFKSGSGVEFCEAKGMMSFVVTLGNEFLNNTKGLLGTYNNNPDDDFTLPNGNVLDPNSNSSTIHYDFGLNWQITANESLFTYGPNESVHTFANANFKPMFVEEIKWADNATEQAAKKACGDDAVCLFDAASTNDVSIGTNSKDVNVKLVKENEKL